MLTPPNLARQPFKLGNVALVVVSSIGIVLFALPFLALAARSIADRSSMTLVAGEILPAILLSFVTTGISLLLTIVFGTPLAYILARWRFGLRQFIIVLVDLPIVLPPVVAGLGLLLAFGRNGLLGPALRGIGIEIPFTTVAVIIAQTFVSAPFFIRSALVAFQNISREIEDAARVDGAAGPALFRHVTLPLSWSALAAGLTLSWARALGEFGATIMFAGNTPGRTQTMPLLVYFIFERNIDTAILTAMILIGLACGALLMAQLFLRLSPQE